MLTAEEVDEAVGGMIGSVVLWTIRGGAALLFLYLAVKVVKWAWA